MTSWRITGFLWLIAGLSSGAIAFFITEPATLALFIVGAAAAVLLGLWCLVRPGATVAMVSVAGALAWALAYGIVIALNITNPVEEVLSVVWIAAFGILAGVWAYRARAVIT